MCGICGVIDYDSRHIQKNRIKKMIDSLKHRGPDDNGFFIDQNVSIGNTRLSIIDLSKAGHQPMLSNDQNLVIVYNGEIYNYVELRNKLKSVGYSFKSDSDTEVIVNMFQEYGLDSLNELRGMFSFVIYNKKHRTLTCVRDRFGIKPFYYFKSKDTFTFASEIKTIFTDRKIPREPNDTMIYDYLVFNRTDHTDETCFQGINNLRPGHYMEISKTGNVKINKWYQLPTSKTKSKNDTEHISNFRKQLHQSVQLRLRSDVPVGAALSGGMDSSSIVSIMRQQLGEKGKIHTFSAVYNNNWEKDESIYAKASSKFCNSEAHFTTPTKEDLHKNIEKLILCQEEPFSSTSVFASWSVMKLAHQKGIKVILDGQGADEILGYDYMAAFYFFELFQKLRLLKLVLEMGKFIVKQKFKVAFTLQLFGFLFLPKRLKYRFLAKNNNWISKSFTQKFSKKSNFLNTFFNVKTLNESTRKHLLHKINHLLRYEDKNSMAFSVESRVPFLDHKLVEETLKMPPDLKIRNGTLKFILRKVMSNSLPKIILNRHDKIGFETPQMTWFRTKPLSEFIEKVLKSNSFKKRKYYNHIAINTMFDDLMSGKKNWSKEIWKVICLEMWFKVFIDPTELQ